MKSLILLKRISVSVTFIICLLISKRSLTRQNAGFIIGINGHPLNQKAYLSTPVATQVSLLKSMGISYYRIDVGTDENGTILNEQKFLELATAFRANNLKILPMLYPHGYNQCKDSTTAYDSGKKLASGFALKYGKYFDYYELANEMDLKLLKKRTSDGKDTFDFDQAKSVVICNFLKGMNDGIKARNPTARTIINMCETHYGFIKLLKAYNVNFDIIGQHWYSNSLYTHSADYQNTVNNLLSVYNNKKPIWVTEFNQFQGSINNREDSQNQIIQDFLSNCSKTRLIQAFFIYELLDEPDLNMDTEHAFEKQFGIIKVDKQNGDIQYKKIGKSLLRPHKF